MLQQGHLAAAIAGAPVPGTVGRVKHPLLKGQPMSDLNNPATRGDTDVLERVQEDLSLDQPWQVLLWNDPVNLTDYVTLTLVRVLEIDEPAAERLMLLTHTDGKTAVSHGTKAEAQKVATALQAATLWATLEKVTA